MVSLFELQTIHPFLSEDRNNRDIENWAAKTFLFSYILTPPPFQFVSDVIYLLKSGAKQKNNFVVVDIIVV